MNCSRRSQNVRSTSAGRSLRKSLNRLRPTKKPGLYPQLIAICKKDGCCGKAHAAGKKCDHGCCVKAFAANTVCLKCNPDSKDALAKLQETLKKK